jgi:Mce-associated membrane protein
MAIDADAAKQLDACPADRSADSSSKDLERESPSSAIDGSGHRSTVEPTKQRWPQQRPARTAIVAGIVAVAALATVVGWFAVNDHRHHVADARHALLLEVGKQAAINLTTISHTTADTDVQRILDSSSGTFRDEFQKHSAGFIDVVKQTQSTTTGTVTEAGVESESNDQAQILVAVAVTTSTAAAPEPQSRSWRMRIDVQKSGSEAKVINVEFVP